VPAFASLDRTNRNTAAKLKIIVRLRSIAFQIWNRMLINFLLMPNAGLEIRGLTQYISSRLHSHDLAGLTRIIAGKLTNQPTM
jgi:hypothetical protein